MPDTIRDGKGRGFLASVNSNNQLVTRSTSVEQRLKSAADAHYYEATTGKITLGNATSTGLVYIANTGKIPIVIDRVFYDMWTSTGGTGADGTILYYRDPTISGGTDIVPTNTNFGSTSNIEATVKKSLATISGTAWWSAYITDKQSFAIEEGRIVLPSGSSFAIAVAAPTGNTSMDISINVAMYNLDIELID